MNAKEFDQKFSRSKGLQLFSGVGLAVFTAFMAVSWQKALSQVKTADASLAAVSAPAPENTTTASSPVETVESSASSTPVAETPMVHESAAMTEETSSEAIATTTPVTETPMSEESTPEPTMMAVAEITDPATLQDLKAKLYNQIDQNWTQLPTFSNHLVYRVAVKSNGAIATYEAVNPAANDYLSEIPLKMLSDSHLSDRADNSQESVAKFLVMFTPGGLLEVSPWVSKES